MAILEPCQSGEPDAQWMGHFRTVRDELQRRKLIEVPAQPMSRQELRTLGFFEGVFSCELEGISFDWLTTEQYGDVGTTVTAPAHEWADAVDLRKAILVAITEAATEHQFRSADDFMGRIKASHSELFAHRPEVCPGCYKAHGNQVAGIVFVAPQQVEATLRAGFEIAQSLPRGFPRALLYHQVVVGVHPFVDGNGRVARLMMNTELTASNEWRILIPRAGRYDYRNVLRQVCEDRNAGPLVERMHFYQRWTASIKWLDHTSTRSEIVATGGFADPIKGIVAEQKRRGLWRVIMPPKRRTQKAVVPSTQVVKGPPARKLFSAREAAVKGRPHSGTE